MGKISSRSVMFSSAALSISEAREGGVYKRSDPPGGPTGGSQRWLFSSASHLFPHVLEKTTGHKDSRVLFCFFVRIEHRRHGQLPGHIANVSSLRCWAYVRCASLFTNDRALFDQLRSCEPVHLRQETLERNGPNPSGLYRDCRKHAWLRSI